MPPRPVCDVAADWHIPVRFGGGSWGQFPELCGDAICSLAQVASASAEAGIPLVAPGDLFDGPRVDAAQLLAVKTCLKPLADRGIPLIYVLGNHDQGQDWLSVLPHCVNVSGLRVSYAGVTYSGLSYSHDIRSALESSGLFESPTDVGLYHQTWSELAPCGSSSPVTLLPEHRLAAVGDIHISARWSPPSGPSLAVSSGPLAPQSIAELAPIGVYRFFDDGTAERVVLNHRDVKLVDCGPGETSLDELQRVITDMASAHNASGLKPACIARWAFSSPPPESLSDFARHSGVLLWVRRVKSQTVSPDTPALIPVPQVTAGAALSTSLHSRLSSNPKAVALAESVLSAAVSGPTAARQAAVEAKSKFLQESV